MSAVTKPTVNHKPTEQASITLEAWSEGMMGGALVIMGLITVANMRRRVSLHKLILIELLFALPDCFPMFINPPTFGWYLSSASTFLISSWTLHNVIAWIKCKPFLSPNGSKIYIATVASIQPYWIFQITTNFLYFNKGNSLYVRTRPWEPLFRDPWWIFTTLNLFWNVKYQYQFDFMELVKVSPRFAILLLSMSSSIVFLILEVLAVTSILDMGGLNPFWRLSFIFKCFTDTIVLDDFKTALDKLSKYRQDAMGVSRARDGSEDIYGHLPPNLMSGSIPGTGTKKHESGVLHIEHTFDIELENGNGNGKYVSP